MDLRLSPDMSCQGKLAKSQHAQDDGVKQEKVDDTADPRTDYLQAPRGINPEGPFRLS